MLRIRTPGRHPWQGIWHMVFGPRGHHKSRGCHKKGRHGFRPHCPPPFPPQSSGPHPYCPPPFPPHFPGPNPQGGSGFGCHFGNSWQGPFGNFSSEPEKENKQNEGDKGDQPQSSSEQQMPNFQEIFTQVSEVAKQFMNPGKFSQVCICSGLKST